MTNRTPNRVQPGLAAFSPAPFPPLLAYSVYYYHHHHHHQPAHIDMDTEANWHRITAVLLRENERLQNELDLITNKYEQLQQTIADEAEDEEEDESEASETQSAVDSTDKEEVTDAKPQSDDSVPGAGGVALVGVNNGALPTGSGQLAGDGDNKRDAPAKTISKFWRDRGVKAGDAGGTDDDVAAPTPSVFESGGYECSLSAMHREQNSPSRYVTTRRPRRMTLG